MKLTDIGFFLVFQGIGKCCLSFGLLEFLDKTWIIIID